MLRGKQEVKEFPRSQSELSEEPEIEMGQNNENEFEIEGIH